MKKPLFLLAGVAIFSLFFMVGCERRSEVAGKYVTEERKNGPSLNIRIDLDASGHGSWTSGEENTAFRWEDRGEEIWLHTKEGGLIVGKLKGDRIEVSLPGVAIQHFRKVGE